MATLDAIKAALVHPPPASASTSQDSEVLDPERKITKNIGAKKKKKTIKSGPGTVPSKASTSKINEAADSLIDQEHVQKVTSKDKIVSKVAKSKAVSSDHKIHIPSKPEKSSGICEEQLQKLNQALAKNKNPGLTERRVLAKETNLSEFQVGGWFKKARNNVGEAGKKDVNRPHFLASKLVQPSDAKRHMEKNTAGKNVKSYVSKPDKKAILPKSNEVNVEDKKTSFGGMFSSLKSGSSKGRKISNQPKGSSFKKLDIPVLSSMNQILGVMQAVGGSKDKSSKKGEMNIESISSLRDAHESKETSAQQNLLKEQSENLDPEIMVLDETNKPNLIVTEVIDIVDDDQAVEVDGLVDLDPTKVFKLDKNSKTAGKYQSKKQSNTIEGKVDDECVETNDSNEKLRKELKEKTKRIQNLEIKIPQMISEFTKCVGDKDEVIAAKDKEIKTNKQKLANFEKDTKLLQNRNKNTSNELAIKVKEADALKKELTKDSKEKLDHLHKMEGLEAKVAKLLGVLAKKDEEIVQLNVKCKELLKREGESRKLLTKEKEVSLKLKSKDKDAERKTKARIQESNDKVKELEKLIKLKDQNLVNFKSNDSLKTKDTLNAQQKQIVKLRSTVKVQEKEILSLKEKESRLSVQIADLECENYTKSAELECKNAELDKIVSKVKSGKGSDRRKLSIYEATKDYIEKLKENRKLKANYKIQDTLSDATEVLNVEEEVEIIDAEETMMANGESLRKQMTLNVGGTRPRAATLENISSSFEGYSEHLKNGSMLATSKSGLLPHLHQVDLVMRTDSAGTSPGHLPSMVSHQVVRAETPLASMVGHVVSLMEGDTDMEEIQHKHLESNRPSSPVGRKIAHRSSTGQWGQVYRLRGMHKDVVIRRVEKRRASVDIMAQDDDIIPIKKRKLLDLVEYHNMYEDDCSPVPGILEHLITLASTATTLPSQDSSMVAHRFRDCPATSRYSSVMHKENTASTPSSSISFPSHTQQQTASDNFSLLSHRVTQISQQTCTTSLLSLQVPSSPLSFLALSASHLTTTHHFRDNPAYSFHLHHVANTPIKDIKKTKRQLEEDTVYSSSRKLKKRTLAINCEIVLELVLELVSEFIGVQDQNCHLQVSCIDAQSSFLPHQVVSNELFLANGSSSLLSHQVKPSVPPQAVSSSLLSHQASSIHVPDLPSLVPNVRISPPHFCQTSLLTHQVYHPAILHDISLQSGHLSTKPETGRRKRMREDKEDRPCKRKMVCLYKDLPSITASCKREREEDDAYLPPAKRLKMSRVSGTLLHSLPQPRVEWQIVQYRHTPRHALSDL